MKCKFPADSFFLLCCVGSLGINVNLSNYRFLYKNSHCEFSRIMLDYRRKSN